MQTKKLLLAALAVFCCAPIFADEPTETAAESTEAAAAPVAEKNWKCTGILSLNASATGLWNWAAGGNNNVTTVAAANVTLLYKKNAIAWESNLDTEFGMTYQQNTFEPWRKSNDKINFTTKFGWEFHKTWYLTALAGFKSQYAKGYEYGDNYKKPISSWLSPSYTDISLGIDWKPNGFSRCMCRPWRVVSRLAPSIVWATPMPMAQNSTSISAQNTASTRTKKCW